MIPSIFDLFTILVNLVAHIHLKVTLSKLECKFIDMRQLLLLWKLLPKMLLLLSTILAAI